MTQSFDEWFEKDYPHLIGNHGQTLSMCMGFAKQGYEAGAQSKQSEIDELRKRIDEALEKCYTGIRKQGGDYYLELVEKILKGTTNEQ